MLYISPENCVKWQGKNAMRRTISPIVYRNILISVLSRL